MAKAKPEPTKRPSITDVANLAGVSASAVSKVMRDAYGVSPLMRAKVEDAIKRLGYRPRTGARAMRGQSKLIGVEIPQLGNEFFTQIISGAQERLFNTGYQLVVVPMNQSDSSVDSLHALVDHQVDGILAIAPDVPPKELSRIARYTPFVLLGRHDITGDYDTVVGDDVTGTILALEHLVSLGHTKIAHVTLIPPLDLPDARQPHTIRKATYIKFMQDHDLEPRVVICEPDESGAHRATMVLMASEDLPTAIFAGHDDIAIGVLQAIMESGHRPGEIALIGYDDIDLAAHPLIGLTTIRQFGAQMGRKAVDLLLERIEDGRDSANQLTITPKLVTRGSSGSHI
jgi:LacI family transcriptional regulator